MLVAQELLARARWHSLASYPSVPRKSWGRWGEERPTGIASLIIIPSPTTISLQFVFLSFDFYPRFPLCRKFLGRRKSGGAGDQLIMGKGRKKKGGPGPC
jgi:hypothetical protein